MKIISQSIKKFYTFLIILIGLIVLLIFLILSLPSGKLTIWQMDVGQGDAAFIESPFGQRILIDGGPDATIMQRLSEFIPFYVADLDLIIVSHPHADHLNGLLEVLKRFQVKAVLITGVKYNFGGYDQFYKLLAERGVKIYFADGQHDFKLGKIGLDLLYPRHPLQGESFNNLNNSSIVLRLIYGHRRLFFSGDLEMEKEAELVKIPNLKLGADFLKAGHHGSKTSNTEELIQRIKPTFAVISCGINNKFKHPAPSTVQRFLSHGVTLFRTDLDGTIQIQTNGAEAFSVKSLGKS